MKAIRFLMCMMAMLMLVSCNNKQELTPYKGKTYKGRSIKHTITEYYNLPNKTTELIANKDGSHDLRIVIERNSKHHDITKYFASVSNAKEFKAFFNLSLYDENNEHLTGTFNEDETVYSLFTMKPGEQKTIVFNFKDNKRNQENLPKAKTFMITCNLFK